MKSVSGVISRSPSWVHGASHTDSQSSGDEEVGSGTAVAEPATSLVVVVGSVCSRGGRGPQVTSASAASTNRDIALHHAPRGPARQRARAR